MSSAASHPHLRLVRAGDADEMSGWARERLARQQVMRENRKASLNPALEPTDPRWALAVRTHAQMQGSLLTPERRERVLRTARQLGVRTFDANVIIAVVQDCIRTGRPLSDAQGTLALLAHPRDRARPRHTWRRLAAAIAAATAMSALLIRWVVG
jgi:hypothetical protein